MLESFIGKQEQIPPIYSAIKVNGKKLYEYARKGQNIEIKPRMIEIYNIKFISFLPEENQLELEVFCGKGTYIRSLCEDIATKFETVGYMKSLKRIEVGNFNIEDSVTIEELEKNMNSNNYMKSNIISIEDLFNHSNSITLNSKKLQLFLNGVKLTQNYDNGIYKIYSENKEFIGIGIIENKLLKRDIII